MFLKFLFLIKMTKNKLKIIDKNKLKIDKLSEFICNYYNLYKIGLFFRNINNTTTGYICSFKDITCYIYNSHNYHNCGKNYIWFYDCNNNIENFKDIQLLAVKYNIELVSVEKLYNSYLNGELKVKTNSFVEFIDIITHFIPKITFNQCLSLWRKYPIIETIYYNNREYIYNIFNDNDKTHIMDKIKTYQNLVDGKNFKHLANLSNEWIRQILLNLA